MLSLHEPIFIQQPKTNTVEKFLKSDFKFKIIVCSHYIYIANDP